MYSGGVALPSLATGPALTIVGDLAAVLLLTGYIHLLWRRRPAELTVAVAEEAFSREHPAFAVREVLMLADGRTALVRTTTGELGVVAAQGRGCTSRLLASGDVRRVSQDGAGRVRLRLRDYAHPQLTLHFAPEQPRGEWLAGLTERSA